MEKMKILMIRLLRYQIEKKQQQQKPNQISKKDAQRMLDALNNKEKQVQAKLKKKKGKAQKTNIEKDW